MKQGFKFFVCAAFILGFLTQISPLTAVEAGSTSQQSTTSTDRGRAALRHFGETLSDAPDCPFCRDYCKKVPRDCWVSNPSSLCEKYASNCLSGNYCCKPENDCAPSNSLLSEIPTCACTSETGCVCQLDSEGNATSCTQT